MNKFRFHFQTHRQKDLEVLRQAGFDSQEIYCLCQFRDSYRPNEQDQPSLPEKHLLFARWLVQQGKLNEGQG